METSATSSDKVNFSSDGDAVIQRDLNVATVEGIELIDEYFDVERCTNWITANGFKKVCLQFPDQLLAYSASISEKLRQQVPSADIAIMADTSYGSCCVDDITAEHYSADSIIHYGHSCMSPCTLYPVLYVFGRQFLDADDFVQKYAGTFESDHKVVVFYDVEYDYIMDDLRQRLSGTSAAFSTLSVNRPVEGAIVRCGRCIPLDADALKDCDAIYIGNRNWTMSNLVISLNRCAFFSYSPDTKQMRKENLSVNRTLMKRFHMVEKVKDARIVGIIAGASGHRDHHAIIGRLKKTLKTAGKKYYTFVVGKLNVAKLANFMEIDVYVLVACQENSLFDSSEFYKPVVTPFEVELACNPNREWNQSYATDFTQLLPGGEFYVPMPDKIHLSGDVSLVTGLVRTLGTDDVIVDDGNDGTVTARESHLTVANIGNAGDFLSSRSWSGLEQKLGETAVGAAVEGQSGIARGYTNTDGGTS